MLRFLKRNTEREQIMELLYLYINLSESEFIEKKGFNFSPNYNLKLIIKTGRIFYLVRNEMIGFLMAFLMEMVVFRILLQLLVKMDPGKQRF